MQAGNVQLSILSDGDRTVVEAALHTYLNPSVVGMGSSGREPGDKSDRRVGENLAVARALRSIANRLERQAQGYLRHAESNLRHKEEITAKAIHAYTTGQYDKPGFKEAWEDKIINPAPWDNHPVTVRAKQVINNPKEK